MCRQGASAIAEYLLENYGEDAFSIIVDEGGESMICRSLPVFVS